MYLQPLPLVDEVQAVLGGTGPCLEQLRDVQKVLLQELRHLVMVRDDGHELRRLREERAQLR